MKQTFKNFIVVTIVICSVLGVAYAADPGKVVFCKGFTDKWEPIEPATEFTTNKVSWLYSASKPYGTPQIMLSIYYKNENEMEKLLFRTNIDVNPNWNASGVKDMTFPLPGLYTLTFSTLSGEPIATGSVKIIEKKVEEKPFEEQKKMEGTTLEAIFNKYKPKS
jgi:hypothetical protein